MILVTWQIQVQYSLCSTSVFGLHFLLREISASHLLHYDGCVLWRTKITWEWRTTLQGLQREAAEYSDNVCWFISASNLSHYSTQYQEKKKYDKYVFIAMFYVFYYTVKTFYILKAEQQESQQDFIKTPLLNVVLNLNYNPWRYTSYKKCLFISAKPFMTFKPDFNISQSTSMIQTHMLHNPTDPL